MRKSPLPMWIPGNPRVRLGTRGPSEPVEVVIPRAPGLPPEVRWLGWVPGGPNHLLRIWARSPRVGRRTGTTTGLPATSWELPGCTGVACGPPRSSPTTRMRRRNEAPSFRRPNSKERPELPWSYGVSEGRCIGQLESWKVGWLVGLGWFGLVWFGLAWLGLVWFGLIVVCS